jgi:thiosulfate/3-mercaptopyruvate sulfurtransferase
MILQTLIGARDLAGLMRERDVLIVDCRSDLSDPARGARDYAQGHIPGAVYADLNRDLADLSQRGLGRHPLPEAKAFSAVLSRWGWTPGTCIVAYDDASGAYAARLWWMLRLIGARDVAVLDGGLAAWKSAGLPLDAEIPVRPPTDVAVEFDRNKIVYTEELQQMLQNPHFPHPHFLLLDARAAPRFRGEVEPIDPVAGHVPGARNRPFSENLAVDGCFKPAATLHAEFQALLGSQAPGDVVNMCGSGVTACHNLLAMEYAGLSGARVYAPSWSGWIADPARPVAAVPK